MKRFLLPIIFWSFTNFVPPATSAAEPAAVKLGAVADDEKIDQPRSRELFRKKNAGVALRSEEEASLDRVRGVQSAGGKPPPTAAEKAKGSPVSKPVVSSNACPITLLDVTGQDGGKPLALMRQPPGAGPFPAVIYFHGGASSQSRAHLETELHGQTLSRFLAAGYLTVAGTYRPIRQIDNAILDGVAIVEHVKTIPGVDPKSVVVWGDSAGGSLAFDIAASTPLCAIAVQEPATILFARVGSGENRRASIIDPKSVYTAAAQGYTRGKIRKIAAPIFLAHGDVHLINKFNNEITIPELRAENRNLEVKLYAGENHGFSRRAVATLDAPKRFFEDANTFFQRHLATQPRPLPKELIEEIPVEFDKGHSADREEK